MNEDAKSEEEREMANFHFDSLKIIWISEGFKS